MSQTATAPMYFMPSATAAAYKKLGWGKCYLFFFIVFLPAVAVAISTFHVFRDSFWVTMIALIITVGVAGAFTFYSGAAIPRVRRYCLIADIVIGLVLVLNFCCHFAMARQISAAKESRVERHQEEDRHQAQQTNEANRQVELMKAQKELTDAQAKQARAEAVKISEARKSGLPVPRVALPPGGGVKSAAPVVTNSPAPAITNVPTGGEGKPQEISPEESGDPAKIRAAWSPWFTGMTFADIIVSCMLGFILSLVWQWDRNGNGIPDNEEVLGKA